MADEQRPSRSPSNLIIVVGVILALLLAFLMSSLDDLQKQLLPTLIAELPPAEVVEEIAPLPVVISSTATKPVPTRTATPRLKPPATAVPVLPSCGTVPQGWIDYTVRSGDTLYQLSLRSGATVDEIAQANCLELNRLLSGIVIRLPASPPVRQACGTPANWVPYVVQRRDTMYRLAISRGTTVFMLMQGNCFVNTSLQAGRTIMLPPLAVPPTATEPPTRPPDPAPQPTPIPPPPTTPPIATPTATAVPTLTSTATATPPVATNTPTASPTASPTATATATATPVCLTPLPTGCQATLSDAPTAGSIGITVGWIGLGLVVGLVLTLERPAWRRRH